MYEYFKLTDTDKKELMGIADRLRNSAHKNLTPKTLPADISENDIEFAENMHLPLEFFDYFTIDSNEQ